MPRPHIVEQMKPSFLEVKQQVARLKSEGNQDDRVEAKIGFRNSRGRQELIISLGNHALIANGDLAFTTVPPEGALARNGVFMVKGQLLYISL